MRSATEPTAASNRPAASRLRVRLERWNRKLHYYAGLFLLFFVWLFAVTGLVLNHPTWSFAESWTKRTDTNSERAITALGPELRGDLAQAQEIMRQLGIEGEILWTTTRTKADQFDFSSPAAGPLLFHQGRFGAKSRHPPAY